MRVSSFITFGFATFFSIAVAQNECQDSFSKIPNISSKCAASLPSADATRTVTSYGSVATVVVTKTAYSYRYTLTYASTPSPRSMSSACYSHRTSISTVAPVYIESTSAGPLPTSLDYDASSNANLICGCLFPQATKTVTTTVPSITLTSTISTSIYIYSPTFRTLAPACTGAMTLYNGASYVNNCHSSAISVHACEAGTGWANSSTLFAFDHRSCCDACANTLNCIQAITTPADNKCTLILSANSNGHSNTTSECPLGHPSVRFGSPITGIYDRWSGAGGSVVGPCVANCQA